MKFLSVAKLTFLLSPPITLPPEILKCQLELPNPTLWNFIRLVIKTPFICICLIIPMKLERNICSLLSCHSQEIMCNLYKKLFSLHSHNLKYGPFQFFYCHHVSFSFQAFFIVSLGTFFFFCYRELM